MKGRILGGLLAVAAVSGGCAGVAPGGGTMVSASVAVPKETKAAVEAERTSLARLEIGVGTFRHLCPTTLGSHVRGEEERYGDAEGVGSDVPLYQGFTPIPVPCVAGSGYDYAEEVVAGLRSAKLFGMVRVTNDPEDPGWDYVVSGTAIRADPSRILPLSWRIRIQRGGRLLADEELPVVWSAPRDAKGALIVCRNLDGDQARLLERVGEYLAYRIAALEGMSDTRSGKAPLPPEAAAPKGKAPDPEAPLRKATQDHRNALAIHRTFDRPLKVHSRRLKEAMAQISQQVSVEIPQEPVPHAFDRRIFGVSALYHGMAEVALAAGSDVHAERYALSAIEVARMRGGSPVRIARSCQAAYDFLKRIYVDRGDTGLELLADLNLRMLKDYLDSPQASLDEESDAEVERKGERILADCNKAKADLDRYLHEKEMAEMNAMMGMMVSSMQMQMAAAPPGTYTPMELQSMNQSFQMFNMMQMTMQLNQAILSEGGAPSPSVGAMAGGWMAMQLADGKRGANASSILKDFCGRVESVAPDEATRAQARTVAATVDAVGAVREGGDEAKTRESVQRFAREFAGFAEAVGRIRKR